ncbi:MAG: class I SAM-dependent methyltransferase [Pseudomonadota bacterium]
MSLEAEHQQTEPALIAELVDRYAIYQQAVQSPDLDVELIKDLYFQCRQRSAHHLREDFCGTAAILAEWIRHGHEFSGEGFDNDPEPLEWGKRNNFDPLGMDKNRATLHLADVREPSLRHPDVRCAFNFSYWVFRTRQEMIEYFRCCYQDLAPDGVLLLDSHGGFESLIEEESEADMGDFISVWHQTNICPVDNTADLAIHYRFPDGSEIHNAYQYRWRIWSLPEILEILIEAGFSSSRVFWYEEDDEGSRYIETDTGRNDPAWIACIAALK